MKDTLRKPLLLAIMTAFAAAPTFAQEPTAPPADAPSVDTPAPPKAAQATPINEQKIDQFADAYVAVQNIQMKAAKELDSQSSDPAKQQQTQAAVENEMIAAVERTGLKLDEFNSIVQTMTADADLRARVIAEIRERTGAPAGS